MVEESPRIMTRKELKRAGLDHKRLQPAIKKKLIFANSMVAEIRDSFQANDEQQSTKSVINVVAGKIMKKYRLMRTLGEELGRNQQKTSGKSEHQIGQGFKERLLYSPSRPQCVHKLKKDFHHG